MKENTQDKSLVQINENSIFYKIKNFFRSLFGKKNSNVESTKVIEKTTINNQKSNKSSFIEEMPDKYNAPIAQGGTNVSGGQKQRICIARALAIDPEIMVFDDSFSALDFKTDLQVRENIKNSLPNVTKIIVAQRIGTIMDADEIIVLENGEVVGQGKHKDLLHTCSTYRDIALSQLSKEELGL